MSAISVIGAGLAGVEAAYLLANNGFKVKLYEMKPQKFTPAHKYEGMGELVCSNSLKAMRLNSAGGLLKAEMELFGSLVLQAAANSSVGAGGALAVDRYKFSDYITNVIKNHPNIEVISCHVTSLKDIEKPVIIATGPLTTSELGQSISELIGEDYLYFHDAASPIVTSESIDFSKAFYGARYNRGDDDYINCPFNREEYETFHNELINASSVPLKEFEQKYFKIYEGCMPIEVMAKRGADTIRYGPLKPVGITNPNSDKRPYAVVQLRAENEKKELFNIVGFQTNLTFGEQKRVLSLIPGLENAEFVRYGVMHQNTYINSPKLLDETFCLRKDSDIYFAGQITGVEGYTESAASGIFAAFSLAKKLKGDEIKPLPKNTMMGAIFSYISDPTVVKFTPMSANMGLLPAPSEKIRDKALRYEKIAQNAINALSEYIKAI